MGWLKLCKDKILNYEREYHSQMTNNMIIRCETGYCHLVLRDNTLNLSTEEYVTMILAEKNRVCYILPSYVQRI